MKKENVNYNSRLEYLENMSEYEFKTRNMQNNNYRSKNAWRYIFK